MAWLNQNWKFRKKITINSLYTKTINNYVFSIKFNYDTDLSFYTNDDFSDIRVTDSDQVTLLYHDVVFFNKKTGDVLINVNVNLALNTSKDIYIYYGNKDAVSTNNKINTYQNYNFVSHLKSSPLTTTMVPDKSPNSLMTRYGSNWNISQQLDFDESPIGYGLEFDDANQQFYDIGKMNLTNSTKFVLEAWVYHHDIGDDKVISQSYDSAAGNADFSLYIKSSKVTARIRTDLTISSEKPGTIVMTNNTWYHIGFIWDAATDLLKIYVNGVLDATHIIPGNFLNCEFQNAYGFVTTVIGNENISADRRFDGFISEARISGSSNFNENQLILAYSNIMQSGFYTIDVPEVNEALFSGDWPIELSGYEKRTKFPIKYTEMIGNEVHNRFPFLINIYSKCLMDAQAYGHDIIVTDKYSQKIPFERILFNKSEVQIRFAGAYKVNLYGTARLVNDTNAEGAYRAGYLSSVNNYIEFTEVRVVNLGTNNLKIRYSNGWSTTQTADILINGITTYTINMPPTGSWSTYQTVEIPINWLQEWNTVAIGKNSSPPDIDWIQIQNQEVGHLKGFALLPSIKYNEDTIIYIYFKNANAPIRINPALMVGQQEVVVQAENMTIVSGYSIENDAIYGNNIGLSLFPTISPNGEAQTIFTGASGYYDIIIEHIAENDGVNNFSIEVNNINKANFIVKQVVVNPLLKTHHVKRKIFLNQGDLITVKGSGNATSTWARIGQLNFIPTVFDPNTSWNSEEVWGDYEAVWHTIEVPGESRPIYDYSGKERHLFTYNMNAGTNDVNSSIGAGILFYDLKDVIYGQFNDLKFSEEDFTITSWVQRNNPLDVNDREGLFVSGTTYVFWDNQTEFKFQMGDETKMNQATVASDEYFNYYSMIFDKKEKTRTLRLNGMTTTVDVDANNYSGLNDSIAIGRYYDEDSLLIDNLGTFEGAIAEFRIKKAQDSQYRQLNEYKNIAKPQQYINYDLVVCTENAKHYEYIPSITGSIYTNSLNNLGYLEIERINIITTITNSNNTFGTLHIERNTTIGGSITISGSDISTEFIISRIISGLVSSQTITYAGINYILEFVRQFTGGILSGSISVETDEVSYVPDATGSLQFGNIDTSHEINNGFTLSIYIDVTVDRKINVSGTVQLDNYNDYKNNNANGLIYSNGTVQTNNVSNYIYETKTTKILLSGSLNNTFSIIYYNTTETAILLLTDTFEFYTEYIDTYIIIAHTSGTVQINNSNIFIPNLEVSGFMVSSGNVDLNYHSVTYNNSGYNGLIHTFNIGRVVDRVIYNNSGYNGLISTYGNIDYENHSVFYYDPSDFAIGIFSYITEVIHIVEYYPLHNQKIIISGTITADYVEYNLTFLGSILWGKIDISRGFLGETAIYNYLSDSAYAKLISNTEHTLVYEDSNYTGLLKIIGNNVVNIDYNGTYIFNTIQTQQYHIAKINYNTITDYASIIINIEKEHKINYIYTPEVQTLYTAGLTDYFFGYEQIVSGKIIVSGHMANQVNYNNYMNGKIEVSVIKYNKIVIYKPLVSGGIYTSGTITRNIVYKYNESNIRITLRNNPIEHFVEFDILSTIQVKTKFSYIQDKVNYIFILQNGKIKSSGSANIELDTTLLPTGKCIKGRVSILDDVPLPINSTLGDIWYVVNNVVSNWWELRTSGNYEPIANPLFNAGVLGVYNNVIDLPTIGNSIGDVWQIGPCHNGVYYYWDEEWILDPYYPSIIIIERISIVVLNPFAFVNADEVIYNTNEEVSGELLIIDNTLQTTDYEATININTISVSYQQDIEIEYEIVFISIVNIIISNNNTIPVINRNSGQILKIYTTGYAGINIIYNSTIEIIDAKTFGGVIEFIIIIPIVSIGPVLLLGGLSTPDKIDYNIDDPTLAYITGHADSDFTEFITITKDGLISATTPLNEATRTDYIVSNELVVLKFINNTEISIVFEIDTIGIITFFEDVIKPTIIYTPIVSGDIIIIDKTIIKIDYKQIPTGSIHWGKNTEASTVVTGDSFIVKYFPTGGIKTDYYYLEPAVIYNINTYGIINTKIKSISKLDYSNPNVENGSIFVDVNILSKIIYKINTNGVIHLNSATTHSVIYNINNEIVILKLVNETELMVNYLFSNTERIMLLFNGNDILVKTNYEYVLGSRTIHVSGNPIVIVDREIEYIANSIKVNIINLHQILYKPLISTARFIITVGTALPNQLHVVKNVVITTDKVKTSGTINNRTSIYIKNNDFAKIQISGTSKAKCNYIKENDIVNVKITPISIYHNFLINRNMNGKILISGGISYGSSYQVYRYIVSGKIITSGIGITNFSRIFNKTIKDGKIKVSGSNTTYSRSTIYLGLINIHSIHLHGNLIDPVEFYQTYTGIVNAFGTAKTRLYYGHEVAIGIIKVTVDLPYEVEHSEYNKYINASDVALAKFRRFTPVPYFYKPSFSGKIAINGKIKINGSSLTKYIPIFDYPAYGRIFIRSGAVSIPIYKFLSIIEINTIVLSNIKHIYTISVPTANDFALINIFNNDIIAEFIEVAYIPISGGIIWDKGTVVDPTDENHYINENANGLIKLKGSSRNIVSKIFYYEPIIKPLTILTAFGSALYKSAFIWKVVNGKIITSGNTINPIIGSVYVVKKTKIKLSGTITKYLVFIGQILNNRITLSGNAIKISEYKYLGTSGGIITSGNNKMLLSVSRNMIGTILVNGIFNGNLTIIPLTEGWIRILGGIETADYIDYKELDLDTLIIIISSTTKYKTSQETLLEFHELTNRREFEAGLDDGSITYPEDVWSTLQNFNDLIDDV